MVIKMCSELFFLNLFCLIFTLLPTYMLMLMLLKCLIGSFCAIYTTCSLVLRKVLNDGLNLTVIWLLFKQLSLKKFSKVMTVMVN